jgi:hypothetical protein
MPRVNLPPGCAGIADGNWKRFADKPGGHITLDDTDPVERRQLAKLAAQDYASAGLVDAGPEKFFSNRVGDGRWCRACRRLWNRWNGTCVKCGGETVPEAEMPRDLPAGQYVP